MKWKLIIFDCDGTLVESEAVACQVYTKYQSSLGVHFTIDEFKEKFIGTGADAPIVKETFAKLPPHAEKEGDRLLDQALESELQTLEGIPELLKKITVPMCVASNSSMPYLQNVLQWTDLNKYFGGHVSQRS